MSKIFENTKPIELNHLVYDDEVCFSWYPSSGDYWMYCRDEVAWGFSNLRKPKKVRKPPLQVPKLIIGSGTRCTVLELARFIKNLERLIGVGQTSKFYKGSVPFYGFCSGEVESHKDVLLLQIGNFWKVHNLKLSFLTAAIKIFANQEDGWKKFVKSLSRKSLIDLLAHPTIDDFSVEELDYFSCKEALERFVHGATRINSKKTKNHYNHGWRDRFEASVGTQAGSYDSDVMEFVDHKTIVEILKY